MAIAWQDINVPLGGFVQARPNSVQFDSSPIQFLSGLENEQRIKESEDKDRLLGAYYNVNNGLVQNMRNMHNQYADLLGRQTQANSRFADAMVNQASQYRDAINGLFSKSYPQPTGLQNPNMPNIPIGNDRLANAWAFTKHFEGGYNNDNPNEGPVNMGINLRWNKNDIPDYNRDGVIDANDIKMLTPQDAQAIWYRKHYQPSMADSMSPALGNYFSDFHYTSGGASNVLRGVLNAMGGKFAKSGGMEKAMVDFMNALDQRELLTNLHNARLAYYGGLKDAVKYGNGWRNRANAGYNMALRLLQQ